MPATPKSAPPPAKLGFRMPAEWEMHEATWIAWPHNRDDWPGKFQPIPWVYADIVRHLAVGERVRILVDGASREAGARRILSRAGADLSAVEFHRIATDRVWTRDFGPIFVTRRKGRACEVAATNWHFNGWAKYPDWKQDDAATEAIIRRVGVQQWKPSTGTPARRVVLEGGSIDVNGAGLMLTTEECLLSDVQQRNPGLARRDLERVFADYLGVRKVIWLKRGIAGDDTHGHVDDLARFTDAYTVVVVSEPDRDDANHEPLRENHEILRRSGLRVVKLPMPAPVIFDGQRLPASYANFYIANAAVLVPTFNDPNDPKALAVLQRLFPGRRIIGIHCLDLVWGLGTLHCMTQQQPSGSGKEAIR
jgi:agmatine deiminase